MFLTEITERSHTGNQKLPEPNITNVFSGEDLEGDVPAGVPGRMVH
jgi:hypothetical protein